jgi:hypothetical protein
MQMQVAEKGLTLRIGGNAGRDVGPLGCYRGSHDDNRKEHSRGRRSDEWMGAH